MRFPKGQSGNPGGRPKIAEELKTRARIHTDAALGVLIAALKGKDMRLRVHAAEILLDRGWGKAAQSMIGGDENDPPVRVVTRIELVDL